MPGRGVSRVQEQSSCRPCSPPSGSSLPSPDPAPPLLHAACLHSSCRPDRVGAEAYEDGKAARTHTSDAGCCPAIAETARHERRTMPSEESGTGQSNLLRRSLGEGKFG
ncbi:unnamed protein product [Prorocentrum cordatum]|uniref:Aurora kinase n=1 Tax=Prorocentrum cordatum TaxID=2364126 RepID=A0ABN9UZB0_9DINO|nr:unnamed protein product [Polarella glacialis]